MTIILARHLADARAPLAPEARPVLTHHDYVHLVQIADAWNADRIARNAGPPLTLPDVLRNVLETLATLVVKKEGGT